MITMQQPLRRSSRWLHPEGDWRGKANSAAGCRVSTGFLPIL